MNLHIRGTEFFSNHALQALVNEDGRIAIPYAVMERNGFNARFVYDATTRTFFNGDWSRHTTDTHIAMVRVPSPDRLKKMDTGTLPAERAWELPKVGVGEDRFFVDVIGRELIQVKNLDNRISFNAMSDKITHLELAYHTQDKKAFQGTPEEAKNNPAIQRVQLPSMIALDPEFMREVMKPALFEARKELERRLQLFEQQWTKRHSSNKIKSRIRK